MPASAFSIPELYQLITLALSSTSLSRLPPIVVMAVFVGLIAYSLTYPYYGPYSPANVRENIAKIMEDANATYDLLKSERIAQLADEEEHHKHSAAYDALFQQPFCDIYHERALLLHPMDSFRFWRDAGIWRSDISSWVNRMKTAIKAKQLSSESTNTSDELGLEAKSSNTSSESNIYASASSGVNADDVVGVESYPLSFMQGPNSSSRGGSMGPPGEEDITNMTANYDASRELT
ncbi:uncharacterized protein EV420DRAFT_1031880 [Desarmillaria tabescens]|uniref:Uncharacterized protein n=1 Tax=Armillaria tabescens TaxID=1929756 RepID=A0AA39NEU0_ARMTA|nr:uncharacterized protein EV420DRAFT_1031880 [Desarmillaria tabescens]KAK0464209.1 hypothetical protein EV420DRAFT_1031880 [Desarmillaria tabescens]